MSSPLLVSLSAYLLGLALALLPYLLFWYLPNRQELARVNAYYLNHQLKPDSLLHLWHNIQHAFFGDDRGLAPYLFRHSPVTFALALLWLMTQGKNTARQENVTSPASFLATWLLLLWGLMAVISYAPDRYYVLFYPALCGLAALALNDLNPLLSRLWHSRWSWRIQFSMHWRQQSLVRVDRVCSVYGKRALLGGFLAYHLGEALLHHLNPFTDICLYAFTGLMLLLLALLPSNVSQWRETFAVGSARLPGACVLLWTLIAALWFGDWMRHIRYTQRDADAWLATHLPADSVLIGDVAPGLCLNNRFKCVNVIPGLCNDRMPVERFAPAPRYIIILDDKFKEPWWRKNYSALVAPDHLLHKFTPVVRLPVGIYQGRVQDSGFRIQGRKQ